MTNHTDLPLPAIEVVPSGSRDPGLPIIIGLHGRGSDSQDLAGMASEIDGERPFRFFFPNAPKPFEVSPGMAYGFTWFDGWPASRESIDVSRRKLNAFIDEVKKAWPDHSDLALMGFSQGGLMTLDVGFRRPDVSTLVVMSGALYEKDPPDFRAQPGKHVLIVHGLYDDVIPVQAARRARAVLMNHGFDPDYEEYPIGHHVSAESMARVRQFLVQSLK